MVLFGEENGKAWLVGARRSRRPLSISLRRHKSCRHVSQERALRCCVTDANRITVSLGRCEEWGSTRPCQLRPCGLRAVIVVGCNAIGSRESSLVKRIKV